MDNTCCCCCNCPTSCNAYMHVYNYGNYYLRFCGTYKVCGVTYKYQSKFINMCEDELIYIPNKATCITLTVEMCSCSCESQWQVIMKKNYKCASERCFVAYGSECCYCCKQVPCDVMSMLKDSLPQGVFMPSDYICDNWSKYCSYNPCKAYGNECCKSNPSYLSNTDNC